VETNRIGESTTGETNTAAGNGAYIGHSEILAPSLPEAAGAGVYKAAQLHELHRGSSATGKLNRNVALSSVTTAAGTPGDPLGHYPFPPLNRSGVLSPTFYFPL
jgi:hypothetical protein